MTLVFKDFNLSQYQLVQERKDELLEGFSAESLQKNNEIISNIKSQIEEVKKLISENRNHQTIKILDECIINLSYLTMKVKDVENAFNIPGFDNILKNIKGETQKHNKNLPSGNRKDKLNEASKTVTIDRSNIGGKFLSVEEEIVQERTKLQIWGEQNVPGISINLLPGGGYWKRIEFWQNLRELKQKSEKEIKHDELICDFIGFEKIIEKYL